MGIAVYVSQHPIAMRTPDAEHPRSYARGDTGTQKRPDLEGRGAL